MNLIMFIYIFSPFSVILFIRGFCDGPIEYFFFEVVFSVFAAGILSDIGEKLQKIYIQWKSDQYNTFVTSLKLEKNLQLLNVISKYAQCSSFWISIQVTLLCFTVSYSLLTFLQLIIKYDIRFQVLIIYLFGSIFTFIFFTIFPTIGFYLFKRSIKMEYDIDDFMCDNSKTHINCECDFDNLETELIDGFYTELSSKFPQPNLLCKYTVCNIVSHVSLMFKSEVFVFDDWNGIIGIALLHKLKAKSKMFFTYNCEDDPQFPLLYTKDFSEMKNLEIKPSTILSTSNTVTVFCENQLNSQWKIDKTFDLILIASRKISPFVILQKTYDFLRPGGLIIVYTEDEKEAELIFAFLLIADAFIQRSSKMVKHFHAHDNVGYLIVASKCITVKCSYFN